MSELALQLIAENKRTKSPFLDLGNCGLNQLPIALFDCVWIERLNLGSFYFDVESKKRMSSPNRIVNNSFSGNELNSLQKLKKLHALFLSFNKISDLKFLEKLSGLQFLDLLYNKITDYSINSLTKHKDLKFLDIGYNEITNLSINSLEKLTNLSYFDISKTKITNFGFLENLNKLQFLRIENNNITTLDFLKNLNSLQFLNLSNNNISSLNFLEKLTELEILDVSDNVIIDFSVLNKLTQLKSLNLSQNKNIEFSSLFYNSSLTYLSLASNRIEDISFIQKLSNLQTLGLGDNKIKDISCLSNLLNLNKLYLWENQISDISVLKQLTNLESLELSDNPVADFSPIKNLKKLTQLNLRNCQIADISFLSNLLQINDLNLKQNPISDISYLQPLIQKGLNIMFGEDYSGKNKISLSENSITTPPMHIIEQGNEAILSWFENIKISSLEPFREAKVILLGEPDAGKSSLLKYLIGKEFEEEKSVTRGVNIEKLVFQHNGNDYQINFWDFGGQEVQQSVHQYFLTENTLYIVVLNAVTDEQPDKYLQFLDNNAPNSPFIIVTNKDDLQGTSKLKNNQLNNDYEGRLIASNLRISLRQAAKKEWCDNNENIFEQRNIQLKNLFDLVKTSFLKLPHIEEGFLANYKEVKKVVEHIYEHEKKPYITMQEFQKACIEKGVVLGTEKGLLSQLNFIGTVRYLDEDNLRGLHILNPEWLSDGIYRIITDGDVKNKKFGKIQKSDIQQILISKSEIDYTYQDHEIDFIVEMMCQFKVAYFERENKTIYIPDSFPEDLPTDFDKKAFISDSKHYFFSYNTEIPSYIISRFIVKSFQNVKGNEYWNKGIVLEDKEHSLNPCEALIEQNDRKIDIWIKGKDIQSFFVRIRENLRNAHEKTFKKYTEMIDLGEESVLYETIWSYKIDGDQEYKSSVVIDPNTGKLKRYNINEILGRFETREIMEKKGGDTYIIHGDVNNPKQFGGKGNKFKEEIKETPKTQLDPKIEAEKDRKLKKWIRNGWFVLIPSLLLTFFLFYLYIQKSFYTFSELEWKGIKENAWIKIAGFAFLGAYWGLFAGKYCYERIFDPSKQKAYRDRL